MTTAEKVFYWIGVWTTASILCSAVFFGLLIRYSKRRADLDDDHEQLLSEQPQQ